MLPSDLSPDLSPGREPRRKTIRAVPVDNEPEPFWEGQDEVSKIDAWKLKVAFEGKGWGTAEPVGKLNGSSGAWLTAKVLNPLGLSRADAWITDSLNTYRVSDRVAKRLPDICESTGAALPLLADHPSEDEIVREALESHRERLAAELEAARPDRIVTLGNAALRVMSALLKNAGGSAAPKSLRADERYGTPVRVRIDGRPVTWWPLAHPGAPKKFQEAHDAWAKQGHGG